MTGPRYANITTAPSGDTHNEPPCTHDPETWFSDHQDDIRHAQRLCVRDCPIATACRTWADTNDEKWGTWGGVYRGPGVTTSRRRGAA